MEFLVETASGSGLGLIMGLAFASIVFLVGAVGYWFVDETPIVKRRLKAIQEGREKQMHTEHREGAFMVRWAEPLGKAVLPSSDWMQSRLRSRLVHAGYNSEKAFYVYGACKLFVAILVPMLFMGVSLLAGDLPAGDLNGIALLVALAVFGFYVPDIIVTMKAQDRQRVLREDFPDALDLMVVCVEAGLGLDAAIQRVAKELQRSHPELGMELTLVTLEMKAGKSKEEALKAFSYRTGLPEIKALASILIQAEHFGTSIAASLSGHADEMRQIRIQNARERAAKLPVKMVFPVMGFIFPALFLVLLGPAVIRIMEGFSKVFGAN